MVAELNPVTFATVPQPVVDIDEQLDLAWRLMHAPNDPDQHALYEFEYWFLRANRGRAA